MFKKLLITLGILLALSSGLEAREFNKAFRIQLAKETATYYNKIGLKREYTHYLPFVNSAINTAKYFPMYPVEDELDRVLSIYTMPGKESYYKYNFVNVNVPGMKYSSGKVKQFGLDYTSVGLNEGNITWTYRIAKDIQNNKTLKNKYASRHLINKLEGAYIPKDLYLRPIDLSSAKLAKQWYRYYLSQGYTAKQIYFTMSKQIKFKENTVEEIQSAFIYRAIVEIDRDTRGWNHTLKDEKLYSWLKQRMN